MILLFNHVSARVTIVLRSRENRESTRSSTARHPRHHIRSFTSRDTKENQIVVTENEELGYFDF